MKTRSPVRRTARSFPSGPDASAGPSWWASRPRLGAASSACASTATGWRSAARPSRSGRATSCSTRRSTRHPGDGVLGGFHLTGQVFEPLIEPTVSGAHPAAPTDPHRARPLHRMAGPAPVRRQPGRGLRAQRRRHVVRPGRLSPVEGAYARRSWGRRGALGLVVLCGVAAAACASADDSAGEAPDPVSTGPTAPTTAPPTSSTAAVPTTSAATTVAPTTTVPTSSEGPSPDPAAPPGTIRYRFRYGPIEVAPGQNVIRFSPGQVPKPEVDGYIVRHPPRPPRRQDGSIPGVDVIHLHHGVWLNRLGQGRLPRPAARAPLRHRRGEDDHHPMPQGYGYAYKASDKWLINYMIHNLLPEPDQVSMTYDIDFIPATPLPRGQGHPGGPADLDGRGRTARATRCSTPSRAPGHDGEFT